MKIKILTALLLFTATLGFSQNYMEEIAIKACDCLNKVSDTLEKDRFNMELGLCMIEAASPYKKQLLKDYKIDLNKIDQQGEELGKLIGFKMGSVCPEGLIKIVNKVNKTEDNKPIENVIEGQLTSVIGEKFIEFSIKDFLGKVSKYYWLTFIESDIDLINDYKTLIDKNVRITFLTQDFFDARIGEYRPFNIIQKIEIIAN